MTFVDSFRTLHHSLRGNSGRTVSSASSNHRLLPSARPKPTIRVPAPPSLQSTVLFTRSVRCTIRTITTTTLAHTHMGSGQGEKCVCGLPCLVARLRPTQIDQFCPSLAFPFSLVPFPSRFALIRCLFLPCPPPPPPPPSQSSPQPHVFLVPRSHPRTHRRGK